MPTATSLRVSDPHWDQVCSHLLRDDGREHAAFLFVGPARPSAGLELLVAAVKPIDDRCLVGGSQRWYLEIEPATLLAVVNEAIERGLGLVEVHNHPGTAERPVAFSPSDASGFKETVPYMLGSLTTPLYGALVLGGRENLDGLVWDGTADAPRRLDEVVVVGPRRSVVRPAPSVATPLPDADPGGDALSRFDRQVRAFGREGQRALGALSVGVVGLGGLGTFVAQELARIGVGRLVLIDHDIVDWTNLSRILAGPDDARLGRAKVDVAAERIREANPEAEAVPLAMKVFDGRAIDALASVDLIVGCTDDAASRYAINEIALACLRPYIDLGTEIHTEEGRLVMMGGRVTPVFPGRGCLLCAGAIDPREAAAEFVPHEVREVQARAGYIAGSSEPAPAVMPLNGIIASLACFQIQLWTVGAGAPAAQTFYDGGAGRLDQIHYTRETSCLLCGNVLGQGDLASLKARYARWAGGADGADGAAA